jgi:predicted transcriptional regulator
VSVSQLLFELASDDRLTILSEVGKQPVRLSDVARKLTSTVQEASRQLERLAEARLVSRGPDSRYEITPLGRVALELVPSFRFVFDERDFFLSHEVSSLPPPFVHRLGELSVHRRINRLDETLALSEELIRGARKYVWFMSDQPIRQSFPHEHPAGVDFRLIFPKEIDSEAIRRVRDRIGSTLQVVKVDRVQVSMAMNESIAAVYFPTLDGRMDLTSGFTGEEAGFHAWCEDLYEFYWGRGREGRSS